MDQKTLTVAPAAWSGAHAEILARACGSDKGSLADWCARVAAGAAQLLEVTDAGRLVGAVVLWIDRRAAGPEGVIAATAGAPGAGVRLLDIFPELERRLIAAGCVSLRVHPCRAGLVKFLAARGYQSRAWEMGKVVA